MSQHKFRAIVVDDESDARGVITTLLEELYPNIEVCAEAESVGSAIAVLENTEANILFLDVQLSDGNGFDVIEQASYKPEIVIFVTAFDKYAISAIRKSAFDYLLKPISRADFREAINRALLSLHAHEPDTHTKSMQLRSNVAPMAGKVALPSLTGLNMVDIQQIIRCEADGNYTLIYLTSGRKETISRTLGQFEKDLLSQGFFRIHHKHLVNLNHVLAYHKGKAGGSIELVDGAFVEVSTRKKPELLQVFQAS